MVQVRHAITCPRCTTATSVVAIETLELDCCAGCGGIWFDLGEVKALRQLADDRRLREQLLEFLHAREAGPTLTEEVALSCPVCALKMVRRHHEDAPGVVVDRCQQHGTWLDQGEAERLLALAAQHEEARRQREASRKEHKSEGWFAALLDLLD